MRYIDEYRDADLTRKLLADIRKTLTRPRTLMEVCGGQTHSILKSGLDQLLPSEIDLVHGPGCPVCVTPLELIDKALAIAARPEVIFCSFGDMLRVPGSSEDLFMARAAGGRVVAARSPYRVPQFHAESASAPLFLVLVLITIVASFNIVSTLTMIVTEKQKEIAILKAMGATSRQITTVFALQGGMREPFGEFLRHLALPGRAGCQRGRGEALHASPPPPSQDGV